MSALYSIKAWGTTFEDAESRKLKKLPWLRLPALHDSRAYRRLLRTDRGLRAYGAFIALVRVAATCEPRGVFRRDDSSPLDTTDLSVMTGIPEPLLVDALEVLCSEQIGWISQQSPSDPPVAPGNPMDRGRDGTGREETGQDEVQNRSERADASAGDTSKPDPSSTANAPSGATAPRSSPDVASVPARAVLYGAAHLAPKTPFEEVGRVYPPQPSEAFEQFFAAYPKATKKLHAWNAWQQASLAVGGDQALLALVLPALGWQEKTDEWQREARRYVPKPETYLASRQWEDRPSKPSAATRRNVPSGDPVIQRARRLEAEKKAKEPK